MGHPVHCSLGAAACYLLFMLTCAALLMTSWSIRYIPQPHIQHHPLASNIVPTLGEGAALHDFGNVSAHNSALPAGGVTSVTSATATYWSLPPPAAPWAATPPAVSVETKHTPVVFRGLPVPVHCDGSYGTCPIRLQGSGAIVTGDGSLVQSAIVYYAGGTAATSIVCFRSNDGLQWDYTGTIANASDYPASEEGPVCVSVRNWEPLPSPLPPPPRESARGH